MMAPDFSNSVNITLPEELTTVMHSEFKVIGMVDLKHRCLTLLDVVNGNLDDADYTKLLDMYGLVDEDVRKYVTYYEKKKKR